MNETSVNTGDLHRSKRGRDGIQPTQETERMTSLHYAGFDPSRS